MNRLAAVILLMLAALIGIPMAVRPDVAEDGSPTAALKLIILSPHNEQIRWEFGRGFDRWHRREYGEAVSVIWNTPGGTSDIRRMLQSQYRADLLNGGARVGGSADLVFGGGSYEFGELKKPITVEVDGETRSTTIIEPVPFSTEELEGWYGENSIGDQKLHDPDKHWFGTALSGFGIVFNRDRLRELGVEQPSHWEDLCNPRLRSWVALVNPAQSGSVTTAFAAIIQRHGWTRGWQILRRMAANARYFSGSSPKGPIDVGLGDAAVGVCIDFYGRFQAQALTEAGAGDRVGYVDPAGETVIDPDPIALLRGAPSPELAVRFIRYCLTDEAQSLWQFRRNDDRDGLGPEKFELRRLPITRSFYERYAERCIDQVDPFAIAAVMEPPVGDYRSFVVSLFAAMAVDSRHELQRAWDAIVTHPAYPDSGGIVTADDVSDPQLQSMLTRFDAMPSVRGPAGARFQLSDPTVLNTVKAGWLREAWRAEGLWPAQAMPADILRREFTDFFRSAYAEIAKGHVE